MKQTPPSRRKLRRPGVAYVLAMLYLLLFTVLSVGFCAASAMSMQIARNDRLAADAQGAAESGMQLVRYQLGQVVVPVDTSDAKLISVLAPLLSREVAGQNFSASDNLISTPSETEWSLVDPTLGTKYRAHITSSGPTLWVKVIGRGESESITRAIQMQFKKSPASESQPDKGSRFVADIDSYEEVSP